MKIINNAIDIIRDAGTYLRNEQKKLRQNDIEQKGVHDFVSYVDKTSEKFLVENLQKIFPQASFIVEENTIKQEKSDYYWIIDPLDGTTNFIHNFSPFAISVALMHKNEIIAGIVYEVGNNEMFYAIKEKGSYLNNKKIKVGKAGKLSESIIATGFPYYDYSKLDGFMNALEYFVKYTHGVRRFGTAATDLAYIACGRFDAYFEYSLHAWDVAAGSLLVQEAGGIISDFAGKNNFIFGKEIIATNKLIYHEFLNIIKQNLNVEK